MKNKKISRRLTPFVSAAIIATMSMTTPAVIAQETSGGNDTGKTETSAPAPTNNDIGIEVGVGGYGLYKIPNTDDLGFGTEWNKKYPEESGGTKYEKTEELSKDVSAGQKKTVILALSVAKQAKMRTLTKQTIKIAKEAGYTGSDNPNTPETVEQLTAWSSALIYSALGKGWDPSNLSPSTPVEKDFETKLGSVIKRIKDESIDNSKIVLLTPADDKHQVVVSLDKSSVPNALTLISSIEKNKPEETTKPSAENPKDKDEDKNKGKDKTDGKDKDEDKTPSTTSKPTTTGPAAPTEKSKEAPKPPTNVPASIRTSASIEKDATRTPAENKEVKPEDAPKDLSHLKERLEGLVVNNTPNPDKKYDRKDFKHWSKISEDFNWPKNLVEKYKDCTTRNAVLLAGGTNVYKDGNDCKVKTNAGGGWNDIYGTVNGTTVAFENRVTDPKKVDVDHIVPLKDVWTSGGYKLSDEDKEKVANDFMNLVATTQKTNRSKGDKSAAQYVPPSDFKCEYVNRYVNVKDKYKLTVTQKEKDRLTEVANICLEAEAKKKDDETPAQDAAATITDTVSYTGLTPGKQYTIKGELVETDTGKVTGVKAEKKFTPEAPNGEVKVEFKTTDPDKKVTVFEHLFDENGRLVADHRDVNDRAQTVNANVKKEENKDEEKKSDPKFGIRVKIGGDRDKSSSRTGTGVSIDTEASSSTGPNLQSGTTVDDLVTYKGLRPGTQYRLEARLICKSNGKDTKASKTHEFTPEKADGKVVVKGIEVTDPDCLTQVVFEKLYEVKKNGDDVLVATHEDIDAESQTVGGDHLGKKKKKKTGKGMGEDDSTTPTETRIEYAPYPDYGAPRQVISAVPSGQASNFGNTIFNR